MAIADVKLTHASVNSGTAVSLRGVAVNYAWKNLVKATPVPGKRDTVEVGNLGFENAKIIVRGAFDVDDATANTITQTLLVDFATLTSTTPITLTVKAGAAGSAVLGGRPTAGYETDGAQTLLGTIKVWIESFDISFNTEIVEGQRWDYSIQMVETT